MSTFDWLLVGHLLGDWMLQNDWMARGKQQRLFNPAIFVHCTVYTGTLVAALWQAHSSPLTISSYLFFALCIFLSHWGIDAPNLAGRWTTFFRQSDHLFVRIMVDQTLHLLVLAGLLHFLVL
jgi:Protein of unknown function (DUF3307)